jgi:hypothetical protein
MSYQKPEILASYYTPDIIGTAVGNSSNCILDHDGMPDCNNNM